MRRITGFHITSKPTLESILFREDNYLRYNLLTIWKNAIKLVNCYQLNVDRLNYNYVLLLIVAFCYDQSYAIAF